MTETRAIHPADAGTVTGRKSATRPPRIRALLLAFLFAFAYAGLPATLSIAQMGPQSGDELNGIGPMAEPSPANNQMPAPVPNLRILQPVHASMMVSPPYGIAPLSVGFFVIASDPEQIGFLTYSWNFGDGSVSSLPPEMYIFHTYHQPGNYVCTLTMTTVDGRKNTVFQGVLVRPKS
ncbi:MAG TPA: PKD domain-containing protein [Candidatus Binataceae bacterium]|nr:PKD domain-containing protein [Candidatus Binataceae bacterium]